MDTHTHNPCGLPIPMSFPSTSWPLLLMLCICFDDTLIFLTPWTYLIALGIIYNILVVQIDLDASELDLVTFSTS